MTRPPRPSHGLLQELAWRRRRGVARLRLHYNQSALEGPLPPPQSPARMLCATPRPNRRRSCTVDLHVGVRHAWEEVLLRFEAVRFVKPTVDADALARTPATKAIISRAAVNFAWCSVDT